MKEYDIKLNQSEIVDLIKLCDTFMADANRKITIITVPESIELYRNCIGCASKFKEKLLNVIHEKTVDEVVSSLKIGDTLYDISYGGIMAVTIKTIETYETHNGKYYTISATSNDGFLLHYNNSVINKTVFTTYNAAKELAVFANKNCDII